MNTEIWRLFWAKTNREKIEGLPEDWTHPLWAHLIDVGSAAQVLWDEFLPRSLKQKMADALGMNLVEAGRFLSIWIGLHDLGKGIPSFQEMHEPSKLHLFQVGLIFHQQPHRLHHGHASIAIVYCWLRAKDVPYDTLLDAAAACVGIHHGKLCHSDVWEEVANDNRPNAVLGDQSWKKTQLDLAEAVFSVWGGSWPDLTRLRTIGTLSSPWPDWLMAFAGWATLADWLGSMQRCYDTSVQATDGLSTYLAKSRAGALSAYQTSGLNQQAKLHALPFERHFGFAPRPLQRIACDLPLQTQESNLVIVEGPTGEGKTEAAFYLTARLGGGVYVAMPSQATSDGLFPRLRTFIQGDSELKAAHHGPTAALRLVHGNDLLHEDALSLLAIDQTTAWVDDPVTGSRDQTDPHTKSRVLSWFMPKKRALLVPYGVGTVDQLFLGVLYARHFFLRLFALCGKTIVFDEVHAYDTYMNTLFGQLLRWLRALDVNVVVLSATLPTSTRTQMLEAWGGCDPTPEKQVAPYPVVWHAATGVVQTHQFKPAPNRGQQLTFRWCDDAVESIVHQARALLAQGATLMIICNKVDRAQQVFAALDDDMLLPKEDRMLLHARMPQAWRKQREKAALNRFGKDRSERPGLLVGTQVIEQSLDLDVDVMITDLAPIDLLLQRAGRLHRHQRDNRPRGFHNPVLYIACARAETDELPDVNEVSGQGHIYGRVLLWKTWSLLHKWGGWALPLGNGVLPGYRTLIESVYGNLTNPPIPLTDQSRTNYEEELIEWDKKSKRQQAEATRRIVPPPQKLDDLFTFQKSALIEEEETMESSIPKHLQAFTRDPDGINAEALLLYRTDTGWSTEPEGTTVLHRNRKDYLSPEILRLLFGASVRISQRGIVCALWKAENLEWKAVQEQYRLLQRFHLIELTDNTAIVGGVRLHLNDRVGLIFQIHNP